MYFSGKPFEFIFSTGREYDTMQTLVVRGELIAAFDDGYCHSYRVEFVDTARQISGYIPEMLVFEFETERDICIDVLAYYDAGMYKLS
jgi:hypothetical protein